MLIRRIIGVLLIIAGIASFCTSLYIMSEVEAGKQKISNAQQKVDQGNGLFSLNPITEEIGQGVSSSAQSKINAGQAEIAKYTKLANNLQIGGIVLVIAGAGILFIGKKKKSQ